jgi:predicted RecA/RadA family phage recombinase
MATSTLVQFLSPGEKAPGGPNRSQVETFIAGGTIAAGDFVSLDTSKTGADKVLYVIVVDTSGGAVALGVPTIGVALNAATAGRDVDVVIRGYVGVANVATGVAAGAAIALDTTTSGRATTADAANVNIAGICLSLAASNKAEVFVNGQF